MHSFPAFASIMERLNLLNLQRLSKSVTMVAKGVLKEHLILLGNSMTCAGSLIGFYTGGYKTLSRSLDIQVPFTEATLFVGLFSLFQSYNT